MLVDSLVFAVPFVLLGVVVAFAFTGCDEVFGIPEVPPCVPYDQAVTSESSLVSYWRLGESSGTTAHDVKSSHDGIYEGGVTLGVAGLTSDEPDTAAGFDGSSGQVIIPFAADLNPPKFSAEAWVLFDDAPGNERTVIASFDQAQHTGFAILAGASGMWEAMLGDGSQWQRIASAVPVVRGQITYLVLVYDGSILSFGAASGSAPPDNFETQSPIASFQPNSSAPLLIGGQGPDSAALFQGVIDEVAVYSAALTHDQAANHGYQGVCRSGPQPPLELVETPNPIGVTTATLRGSVNPQNVAASYHFEYGETQAYGSSAPSPDAQIAAGTAYQFVSQPITGLKPHTGYHFRLVASSSGGSGLSLDESFTTQPSTAYRDAVVATPGLVAYWRLNEASGSMAFALGPAGAQVAQLTGTYIGNPTLRVMPAALDPSGDPDPAVGFNGSSQFVLIPLPASQWAGGDFTIELWFKTNKAGPGTGQWYLGAGLLDGDVAGLQNDFGTSVDSGGHVLAGTGNPDITVQSPGTYLDNAWHQVVFTRTRSSGTLTLFLDGNATPVATRTGASTGALTAPPDLNIAKVRTGPAFQGSIDEVAIYSRGLTGPEVNQHYMLATTPP